ncbi:MAG: CPBP family intramembrane metalloprotease [Actinomycetes bacterium]|jgi:membrane protease YdiL (CAAX protease family)|nr:CPBP family intramembrane metalloprotease [Actinomycetes bacterium]
MALTMTGRATHSAAHSAAKKPTVTPRARKGEPRPWRAVDVVWVLATLVLASACTWLVLSNRLTAMLPEVGRVGVRIALLVVFYLLELVVLAWLAHRRELSFAACFHLQRMYGDGQSTRHPERSGVAAQSKDPQRTGNEGTAASARDAHLLPPWASILLTIGIFLLLRILVAGWTWGMAHIGWSAPSSESLPTLFGTSVFGMIGAALSVVVLAPFTEELIFRVVLLRTFNKRLPMWAAAIVQALVFSLYHLSLWAALPNLLLGLACGYLAARARTLWPAIALHVLYNASVVAAAFYLTLVS